MLRTATTQGASVRNGMADIIVCKKLVQTPYLYPLFPPPADNVFEHDTQKSNVDLCCQTRFRRDILDSRKCCIGKIKRGNCTICDHLHWLYDMSRVWTYNKLAFFLLENTNQFIFQTREKIISLNYWFSKIHWSRPLISLLQTTWYMKIHFRCLVIEIGLWELLHR